jgi:hypothetical protein
MIVNEGTPKGSDHVQLTDEMRNELKVNDVHPIAVVESIVSANQETLASSPMKSSMLQSTSQDLAVKIEDTDTIAKEVINIEG